MLCSLIRASCIGTPLLITFATLVAPELGFNPFAIIHITFNVSDRFCWLIWALLMLLQTISVWLFYESLAAIGNLTFIGNFIFGFVSLKERAADFARYRFLRTFLTVNANFLKTSISIFSELLQT